MLSSYQSTLYYKKTYKVVLRYLKKCLRYGHFGEPTKKTEILSWHTAIPSLLFSVAAKGLNHDLELIMEK